MRLFALLLAVLATLCSGYTEINFAYASTFLAFFLPRLSHASDMLRSSGPCVGCSTTTCPLLPPSAPAGSVPISGPVCVSGSSPCSGGAALTPANNAVCLSGAASPFGSVLDVAVRCGANGTTTEWSLCAGTQYGCGPCQCTCRVDTALTAYANSLAFNLTTTGYCFGKSVLPGSFNPLNLQLKCAAC
jgi:hypothetical protein